MPKEKKSKECVLTKCPHCHSTHIRKWSKKYGQKIKDVPTNGKPKEISIDRKRYKCLDCNKTFLEHLEWLHPKHMMTKALVEYINAEYNTRSASSIAKDIGIDRKTVKLVADCTS